MGDPAPDAIASALAEHGPATGPELATLLDAHPATVERCCTALQREDRIRLVTGGRYELVDEPQVRPQQAAD
jgi:DNA-binding IclR family transcriptional regulator